MAYNRINLATPYAKAIFNIAKSSNSIDHWLNFLNNLMKISHTTEYEFLINNPKYSNQDVIEVLTKLLNITDVEFNNFLQLLATNNRLNLLAEIADLFNNLVQADRNIAEAVIQSAFPLNEEDKQQFEKLLSNKFGKTILIKVEVSSELIGGVKILINDTVIDASVKGSLEKMATQIMK